MKKYTQKIAKMKEKHGKTLLEDIETSDFAVKHGFKFNPNLYDGGLIQFYYDYYKDLFTKKCENSEFLRENT